MKTFIDGVCINNIILAAENDSKTKKMYIGFINGQYRYIVDFKGQIPFLSGNLYATQQECINDLINWVVLADLNASDIKISHLINKIDIGNEFFLMLGKVAAVCAMSEHPYKNEAVNFINNIINQKGNL